MYRYTVNRLRKFNRSKTQGMLPGRKSVSSAGHCQLSYSANIPGAYLGDSLLGFAPKYKELSYPLHLSLISVPNLRVAINNTRVHSEMGHFTYIRIGAGHINQSSQRRTTICFYIFRLLGKRISGYYLSCF